MGSKKLVVMTALSAHIAGINPTNNDPAVEPPTPYGIDLRDRVSRGRLTFGADEIEESPLVSILEAPRPIEPVGVGEKLVRKSTWQLLVQGFVKDVKVNPTDPAYDLLALVEMRLARICALNDQGDGLYPGEYRLDGLIDSLAIGEGIVRPSDPQVSPTAFFYLPVAVGLVTDLRNPYAA